MPNLVMVNAATPSRTSRARHYVPVSTRRSIAFVPAVEPEPPMVGPVRELCAVIEGYKRTVRELEAENEQLRLAARSEAA